jgi:ABC-type phosphate transport system substrate-binding protein
MRIVRAQLVWLALVLLFDAQPHRIVQAAAVLPRMRNGPHESVAIIVNRSNPVKNLTFDELRKIFMGERSRWPNGHRVIVTMMESGYSEREIMLRDVYRMTERGYQDHFLKGMYTGDIPVSPKTLSSPEILRKFVFNAPGAIGYLRASDVDGSVKVVRIDGRLPDDLEYELQIGVSGK